MTRSFLYNKKTTRITGFENSLIQLVAGFVTVAVFVGIKNGYSMEISGNDWLWILILGVVNTGIGCYFYFSSIGKLPVQFVAILGYIEPLSAVIFSVVLLQEFLSLTQVIGATCIIVGSAFCECGRLMKQRSQR